MRRSRLGTLMVVVVAALVSIAAGPAWSDIALGPQPSSAAAAATERNGDLDQRAENGVTLVLYGVQRMSGTYGENGTAASAARSDAAQRSWLPSPFSIVIFVLVLAGLFVLARQKMVEPHARRAMMQIVDRVRLERARLHIEGSWIDRAWLNRLTRGDAN